MNLKLCNWLTISLALNTTDREEFKLFTQEKNRYKVNKEVAKLILDIIRMENTVCRVHGERHKVYYDEYTKRHYYAGLPTLGENQSEY